jgi:hypothetical protein
MLLEEPQQNPRNLPIPAEVGRNPTSTVSDWSRLKPTRLSRFSRAWVGWLRLIDEARWISQLTIDGSSVARSKRRIEPVHLPRLAMLL